MKINLFFAAALFLFLACSSHSAKNEADVPADDSAIDAASDTEQGDSETAAEYDEGYMSPDPADCAFYGANCGTVISLSGTKLECGECAGEDSCGGAGVKNECGHPICNDGFCWENPMPQGDTLNAVFALDKNNIWAGGGSTILYNNGVSWSVLGIQLRSGGDITAIWASDKDSAWAAATDGSLLFGANGRFDCSTEAGYYSPVKWPLYGIWGAGASNVWAVGERGILHYDGAAWKVEVNGSDVYRTIFGWDESNIVAAGKDVIAIYNGTAWRKDSFHLDVSAIWGDSPYDFWVAGKADTGYTQLLHWVNSSWKLEFTFEFSAESISIGGYSPESVYFFVSNGAVYRWNGVLIEPYSVSTVYPVLSASASGGMLFVAGGNGLMGQYDGKFWSFNLTGLQGRIEALFANGESDVWALGDRFAMRYNGTRWMTMGIPFRAVDLYGRAYNDMFAETETEIMWHYDGKNWQPADPPPPAADVETMKAWRSQYFDHSADESSGSIWLSWTFAGGHSWTLASAGDRTRFFYKGDLSIDTDIWPFNGLLSTPLRALVNQDGSIWAASESDGFITFGSEERWIWHAIDDSVTDFAAGEDNYLYFINKTDRLYSFYSGWQIIAQEAGEVFTAIASDGSDIYVAGNGLYKYAAAAGVLIPVDHGINVSQFNALFVADGNIWASGNDFLIHFDGTAWEMIKPAGLTSRGLPQGETAVNLTRIFGMDKDNIWMLGQSPDKKTAYIFSWDGAEWVNDARSSLTGTLGFSDVWAYDQENAFIVLDSVGWIYHYKNIGGTGMIDEVYAPSNEPLSAITGITGKAIWAFGSGGRTVKMELEKR